MTSWAPQKQYDAMLILSQLDFIKVIAFSSLFLRHRFGFDFIRFPWNVANVSRFELHSLQKREIEFSSRQNRPKFAHCLDSRGERCMRNFAEWHLRELPRKIEALLFFVLSKRKLIFGLKFGKTITNVIDQSQCKKWA